MRGIKDENKRIAELYIEWKSTKKPKKDKDGHIMTDTKDKILYEYDGFFKFYDKDKGEDVKIPYPFRFIPLEVLVTIKGYNEGLKTGVYSNEVKWSGKEPLTVKTFKGGLSAIGLYKDIKAEIDTMGGKFANSVYIGYKIDGKLVICNIQINGAALSPFIEYGKEHKNLTQKGAMQVKTFALETKGDNTFTYPVFEELEITPETELEAEMLGCTLKDYLDEYFKKNLGGDAIEVGKKEVEKQRMQPNANVEDDGRPPFDINDIPEETKVEERPDDFDLPF